MVFEAVLVTSQTAVPEPAVIGISAIGTLPPFGPLSDWGDTAGKLPDPTTLPSAIDSPVTSWAYAGVVALPPIGLGATTIRLLFKTFAVETKMRTLLGTLLKTALSRVPKSARPAVPLGTGKTKFDSEL